MCNQETEKLSGHPLKNEDKNSSLASNLEELIIDFSQKNTADAEELEFSKIDDNDEKKERRN